MVVIEIPEIPWTEQLAMRDAADLAVANAWITCVRTLCVTAVVLAMVIAGCKTMDTVVRSDWKPIQVVIEQGGQ